MRWIFADFNSRRRVVARSPDRATPADRRSPRPAFPETFGRGAWPGQETGSQREANPFKGGNCWTHPFPRL